MARRTSDLFDLLAVRSIAHPSRMKALQVRGDTLTLSIEGWSWWRADRSDVEGEIRLVFDGISSGSIALPDFQAWDLNEILEDFRIEQTSMLDWAQPASSSIYCSAPIPRPLAVYQRIDDFLQDRNALRRPVDFLNGAHRLSRFLEYTSSNAFLLSTGPAAITELVSEELRVQDVPHTNLSVSGREEAPILVRLGAHGFFCEHAHAEFDAD